MQNGNTGGYAITKLVNRMSMIKKDNGKITNFIKTTRTKRIHQQVHSGATEG